MAKVASNTNFSELLQDSKLVIVDFWATWCGPCRMLSPILDEVEEERADQISVVKVNVDDADEVAAQYRIMSIPTLLFFKNGELVDSEPEDEDAEDLDPDSLEPGDDFFDDAEPLFDDDMPNLSDLAEPAYDNE